MTVAERIRLYKQQKELSQAELAEKSQVSKENLSRYESESSIPPADALKNIADALLISRGALLNDKTVSIKDKELLKKFEVIQDMSEEDIAMVTRFHDLIQRKKRIHKTTNANSNKLAFVL